MMMRKETGVEQTGAQSRAALESLPECGIHSASDGGLKVRTPASHLPRQILRPIGSVRSISLRRFSLHALCASGAILLLLLAGCHRGSTPAAPVTATAPFTPEGRWRNNRGMVLTVHLRPDGALDMVDPKGGHHIFPRVGPERWSGLINRRLRGTLTREGDQLVFRGEPVGPTTKPLAEENGVVLAHQTRAVEDRMTRVTDTPAQAAGKAK
jgi:hypothetical protein